MTGLLHGNLLGTNRSRRKRKHFSLLLDEVGLTCCHILFIVMVYPYAASSTSG